MNQEQEKFQKSLRELLAFAEKHGQKITVQQAEDFFEEQNLTEEQKAMVFEYLAMEKIDVDGAGTGKRVRKEQAPLSGEEEHFLKRYLEELPVPEEPGEDVMVPSFLWEPTQEAPSGAASWKEDPLPVRRRRPASREVLDAAPDAPPLLRDREASGRDAETAMPHEGRAYVFSPRSGREMVEQPDADVPSASPEVFPPFAAEDELRRYDDGGLRDDAPYLQENGPAVVDGDPVRTQAPAGDSVAVPADDRAGEESMLPDEDAAAASGEEDRRELEEALAARGIAMPQPQPEESRKGPARTLSEDMELPAAWSPRDEDEDGPSEAALASGDGVQFSHSVEEQIGGQLRAGFGNVFVTRADFRQAQGLI